MKKDHYRKVRRALEKAKRFRMKGKVRDEFIAWAQKQSANTFKAVR